MRACRRGGLANAGARCDAVTMGLSDLSNASGCVRVVATRGRLWLRVLSAARSGGGLGSDWRETLAVSGAAIEAPTLTEPAATDDVEIVALHEVATSPVALWEPHVANGDWRRALSAWRDASLDALNVSESAMERHLADLVAAGAAAYSKWATTASVDGFVCQMLRDQIGAQYRAGLAAGGDDVDWLGWYRDRVTALDTSGVDHRIALKQGMLKELSNPAEAAQEAGWEFLPDYWTCARPE